MQDLHTGLQTVSVVTCLHKLLGLTEVIVNTREVLGYRLVHTGEARVYLLVEANHPGTYRRIIGIQIKSKDTKINKNYNAVSESFQLLPKLKVVFSK